MGEFAIGQHVTRFEDPRLIQGGGRYTDDIQLPGMAHGIVLRSPHAHAKIKSIDVKAAKAAPGVLAVLTAEDVKSAGFGDLPVPGGLKRRDGSPQYKPRYPILAEDTVRWVGDYVAFVVAETRNQAMDAAELIAVDYEVLPAETSTAEAPKPGAPRVWEDCPDNICFVEQIGDKAAVDAAFAKAAHVVKGRFVINRVTAATMEPRGAVGDYNAADRRYTVYTPVQRPHPVRADLAKLLNVPESKLRIVTGDTGGSFGMKSPIFNETPLVLLASKLTGRPVKWISTRNEAFLSDAQARDNVTEAELALDKDGVFLGAAGEDLRGHRRLSAARHAGLHDECRHARRRLPHARHACRHHRRVLQHQSDAALSRQWAAGGGLRDRAHGGARRRCARHGRDRIAPAQLYFAGADAVQDRAHLHL